MRLLIIDDFLFGHKKLNNTIINSLKKNNDLTVFNYNHYYDDYLDDTDIHIIEMPMRLPGFARHIFKEIGSIYNYIYVSFLVKKNKVEYDKVIFLHINNIGFSYAYRFFAKKNIIVFDHATPDEVNTKYDKRRFDKYKNEVAHVVFDSFIKRGLINDFGVFEDKVKVLVHPIEPREVTIAEKEKKNVKVIVSTGWESDEKLVQEIFDNLHDNKLLKDNNIKMLIRSSKLSYNSDNLVIFNNVLSEEEYSDLYRKADAVLLPYEKGYGYRYSGSALDALVNNKVLIGRNILVMQSLKKEYSENCYIFDEYNDLEKILFKIDFKTDESTHKKFLNNHSFDVFESSLYDIIK